MFLKQATFPDCLDEWGRLQYSCEYGLVHVPISVLVPFFTVTCTNTKISKVLSRLLANKRLTSPTLAPSKILGIFWGGVYLCTLVSFFRATEWFRYPSPLARSTYSPPSSKGSWANRGAGDWVSCWYIYDSIKLYLPPLAHSTPSPVGAPQSC